MFICNNLFRVKKFFLLAVILALALSVFLTSRYYLGFGKEPDVVAKVGDEKIYLKDLEYELSLHPDRNNPKTRELLLDELIKDSIILQAAEKENKVLLSSGFYNSKDKNYDFRLQKLNQIRSLVEEEMDSVSGTIITIWFFNNDRAGTLGYEKGKDFAYKKIKSLRDRVSDGKITIDQAVEEVRSDESLAKIDFAYKTNAKIDFNIKKRQRVTFDEEFDKLLWTVKEGEVSEVYPLKEDSFILGGFKEVAYAFFYIKSRNISDKEYNSFEEWLESYEENIPVVKYL